MLRREFLAVLAAAPFAPKPLTRVSPTPFNFLVYEDPRSRVHIVPEDLTAIALIKDGPCAMFTFHGFMRLIDYSDKKGFYAFRRRKRHFVVPRRADLCETVLAFQRALRSARAEQPLWWRDHPEFHCGLEPFPCMLSRRIAKFGPECGGFELLIPLPGCATSLSYSFI